jgi:multidrug efflux pump subunit AcrA (membrane-fusion protein)
MASDQVPEPKVLDMEPESSGSVSKSLLTSLVLAALVVGEIYTIYKTSAMRDALEAQQTATSKQMRAEQDQLTDRLSEIENTLVVNNEQQMDALENELDAASKRMGSTGGELKHARAMLTQLQSDQRNQVEQLQAQLAQKADLQQVGALNQDVSAQRNDLDNTKTALDTVRSDLGMARSEMGTLIARNHDDIEQLRKLGERDYFEFTAERKNPVRVGGVGLTLTKTNVKRHRFNMELLADDLQVEERDRTIDEPIFFYLSGSKRPYELVVNEVKPNQVKGYLSIPKGTKEVAASSQSGG